jgi:predicted alpha/beta-fold hydrolase
LSSYRAPGWLPGSHAQTLYPLLIRPAPLPYHRQRWETPDGDFIDLDWNLAPSSTPDDRPLLVLFHGLEGSSGSYYASTLMRAAAVIGWAGVVVNFRGCSGESNRLPRAYHSGDSDEIDWILRRLQAFFPATHATPSASRWAAMRCSNGSANARRRPPTLSAGGRRDQRTARPRRLRSPSRRGFNRLYTRHFLHTSSVNAADKLRRYPGLFDERRMRAASNLYEFDEVVTAPLHGFAGADDYWRRASSKPWLAGIRLPTLLLNAQNDPFLPARAAHCQPGCCQRAVRIPAPGRPCRLRHRQPAGATRLAATAHSSLLSARGLT